MLLQSMTMPMILVIAPLTGPGLPTDRSADLALIEDGLPACAIIYPAGSDEDHDHARQLAAAIQTLGTADVPVIPDTHAVLHEFGPLRGDLRDTSLILLGNLNTNRAVFPLYANYYTSCDARYPGGDGYAVHTIVRPFGRDTCYLMVSGSTPEGMRAAVTHALNRLHQLRPGRRVNLPRLHDVRLGPDMARILDPYLDSDSPDDPSEPPPGRGPYDQMRRQFTRNAHLHFYTGRSDFARHARKWAIQLARYDPHAIRVSDYNLENLAAAWRRVAFHDVFSPEERQLLVSRLLETARQLEQSWWRLQDASQGIGGRHHTTGMLAWWTLIRVLLETGQLDDETTRQLVQWRMECEDYLNGLLRHYSDDLDDYQSADSAQNIASYALQSGQLTWFDNGLARRAAQRVMAVTDNLGYYAGIQGYGEALPGWERFTLNAGLLLGSCAFVYDDESFRWPLTHYPMLDRSWGALHPWGLHHYATGRPLPDDPPTWLQGSHTLRFSPYRLAQIRDGDFLASPLMDGFHVAGLAAPDIAGHAAFDKLVVRSSPDPSSMYVLLQGSSAIALSVIDMNALIRLTDRGAIWLLHNTARRSLYFKNALYLSEGLNHEPLPAGCELIAHRDFDEASLAASRLSNYRGCSWTRHLLVLHDRFAVVLDQILADEDGTYHVCATWRTPAFAELTGSAWQSQQNEVTFSLLPGGIDGTFSERPAERDGATRPTILRQNRTFEAGPGDELFLENLLYTSGPQRTQQMELRRVAPGIIVIRENRDGRQSFHLAAAGRTGIHAGSIRTNASLLLINPETAWVAGYVGKEVHAERTTASPARLTETLRSSEILQLQLDDQELTAPSGEIIFSETQSQHVERMLRQLWDSARLPAPDGGEERMADPTLEPVWTHPGPSPRGGRIDGVRFKGVRHVTGPTHAATDWILPVLRAEPRLSPQHGSGSGFEIPTPTPTTSADEQGRQEISDIILSPLENAEFVLELPALGRIDELVLYGDTFGKASPLPPAELRLEVIADGDSELPAPTLRRMTLTREPSWHNLYKGHCYVFERYRARGLNLETRRLRVRILDGSSTTMVLSDVQLFAAEPGPDHPVHLRLQDLDGDGTNEIITWTSDGEIACLNHDGTTRWRDRRPAGIIALDIWNLDDNPRDPASSGHPGAGEASTSPGNSNPPEIFISRTDRWIDVLNSDGTPRWSKFFGDMHRQTDERYYVDGTAVYGMAAWSPATTDATELLFTAYFFMARMNAQGHVLDHSRRAGHVTQIRAVPPGFPRSGDLVMRSDIPWVGPVPLQWWRRETGRPETTCNVPNGRIVHFEVNDFDRDGRVEALIATEEGIGIYDPTSPHTRWEHLTEAPPVGVGAIFEQDDDSAPATLVYAREDGFLCVLAPDGRVRHSTFLDEPARCLTAIRSRRTDPLVLVGTRTSLIALRLDDLTPLWHQPGRYQSLTLLHPDTGPGPGPHARVIAVTRSGTLEAFDF